MENLYELTEHMAELYNRLEDQRSKDIFWARLQYDFEHAAEYEGRLYELTGMATEQELRLRRELKQLCDETSAEGKKLFLYGAAASGRQLGRLILQAGGDFYAYCARNHTKYTEKVLDKEVFPPEYVLEHPDECRVLVAATATAGDILSYLEKQGFPKDQIVSIIDPATYQVLLDRQYFDFPELYPKGTAFVDVGCYDCATSKRFAQWCGGEYSKIIAFEPDPKNFQLCIAESSSLRLELLPFGLSDKADELKFSANSTSTSGLVSSEEDGKGDLNVIAPKEQMITVKVVALDELDIIKNTTIGFIKMDIEGAEMGALHGAAKTIRRDKPLMAMSVYHRRGDVLAIMDYLHELVPEYRFWLRQYCALGTETVLYAGINRE